jgi:hypothetical protein
MARPAPESADQLRYPAALWIVGAAGEGKYPSS